MCVGIRGLHVLRTQKNVLDASIGLITKKVENNLHSENVKGI